MSPSYIKEMLLCYITGHFSIFLSIRLSVSSYFCLIFNISVCLSDLACFGETLMGSGKPAVIEEIKKHINNKNETKKARKKASLWMVMQPLLKKNPL